MKFTEKNALIKCTDKIKSEEQENKTLYKKWRTGKQIAMRRSGKSEEQENKSPWENPEKERKKKNNKNKKKKKKKKHGAMLKWIA